MLTVLLAYIHAPSSVTGSNPGQHSAWASSGKAPKQLIQGGKSPPCDATHFLFGPRARSGTQTLASDPTRGCDILTPHTPQTTHRNTSVPTRTMRARAYGRDHVCRRGLATRLLLAVCTAHALAQQSHGAECTVKGATYYTQQGVDSLVSFISQQECEDVYFSDECVANLQLKGVGLTRQQWASSDGGQVTDRDGRPNGRPKGCYVDGVGAFQTLWYNTGTQDTGRQTSITSVLKRGNVLHLSSSQWQPFRRNLRAMRRHKPLLIPLRPSAHHVCCA